MEVIYIDELFALNLITDYLIVLSSARVCGVMLRRARYLFAALLGAAFAALSLLPQLTLLQSPALKISCGLLMAVIAFSKEGRGAVKCAAVFFAVSAAFGGAVYCASLLTKSSYDGRLYVPLSLRTLVIAFAVCYALVSLVFHRALKRAERETVTVGAAFLGKSAVFRALRDTGNALYDPMTGCEVLIISPRAAAPLFPAGAAEIFKNPDAVSVLEGVSKIPELSGKIRLIPYTAVGVAAGLLPVFRPDALTVAGKPRDDIMIAVCPTVIESEEFEAVI